MADLLDEIRVCRDPVFILTGSRSGSTLLRFILDTHPEIACPPETMITAACVALLRSWDILENAGTGRQRLVTESARLPAEAADTVRETVDRLFARYLSRRGKPRWCDKSLDSIINAELLEQLFPQARFICLYRHCMDVIASGIEACPWGVSRFGFDPYVAQSPGNTVAAIGSYWADTAKMMLDFEERQPERTHRIRYEDLATAPEEVTADLLDFLGAAPAPGITAKCFEAPHDSDGPGDEKIWFTTKVGTETVGRGVAVPAAALPQTLRGKINDLLTKLDYRIVDEEWNNSPGPCDPREPGSVTLGVEPHPEANGRSRLAAAQPERASAQPPVVEALRERIRSRSSAGADEPAGLWPELAGQTITLVVADDGQVSELSWTCPQAAGRGGAPDDPATTDAVDGGQPSSANGRADEPVAMMIAGQREWQALLDGKANLIVELRTGRMRCVNRRDAHRLRSDEVHAVGWLLGLAQVPLAREQEDLPARKM